MKVLFIHTEYKFKGGEDSVVAEEMELLKSNGISVSKLQFTNEGKTLLKFIQLPFNIGSYNKTLKKLDEFQPDIVHIHNLHFAASISVLYAIKKCKIPCVFTLHNYRLICPTATLFYNGQSFSDSLKSNFSWTAVYKGVYNNSKVLTFWLSTSILINRLLNIWRLIDKFIVLTEHTKEIISESNLQRISDKIVVKPNFITDIKSPDLPRNDSFLYVGRLSVEKGINVLLAAFNNSPYSLTIIGDGPLKNEVIDYCKKNSNVKYLGFLNKQAINNELKKCSALIFPSVWYETFGLTIIEAFATSTPVIASNIGAPSLLIKNLQNGLHFNASDADDLKVKLKRWQLLSEQDKESYRINARKTYEELYTPEKNLVMLLGIYDSVIKKPVSVINQSFLQKETV